MHFASETFLNFDILTPRISRCSTKPFSTGFLLNASSVSLGIGSAINWQRALFAIKAPNVLFPAPVGPQTANRNEFRGRIIKLPGTLVLSCDQEFGAAWPAL